MKRVNKVYCLALALLAASALAVPLVFQHGERAAGGDVALQLDGGGQVQAAAGAADVSASHIGSDGVPVIGASFAEIEHFSFRPVMGEVDDSHTAVGDAVLNIGNTPFPLASSGHGSTPFYGAGASSGAMAFNLPFGPAPLQHGAAPGPGASYLPLALSGSAAGSDSGNTGGNAAAGAPVGLDGAGGTPGDTEGVFNPAFTAPANGGLPEGASANGDAGSDVPEPASVALFGLGLLGLAASRRRAAKRASH